MYPFHWLSLTHLSLELLLLLETSAIMALVAPNIAGGMFFSSHLPLPYQCCSQLSYAISSPGVVSRLGGGHDREKKTTMFCYFALSLTNFLGL